MIFLAQLRGDRIKARVPDTYYLAPTKSMRIRLAVLLAVVAGHATVTAKMTGLSKTIELSGALTRVTTSFQFDSAERRSIELDDEHDGYAAATTGSDKRELGLERRHVDGKLELTTSDPVQSFTLNQVLAHRSTPDPPAQQQTEDIKMVYDLRPFDLLSVQDAQSLESMHIKVRCPSPRILDIVTPKGFKHAHTKGSATITITPTEPIASIDRQSSIKIRYVTNEPIASFTEYNRTVELSTYASNINVHDSLVLVNSGPTLKGQFARIDHQKAMMMRKPSTALNALSMALPPAAHDAYYYDTVGNVSTSRFTRGSGRRNAMIEFQPRYPIYGGWKYSFDIGWNLPLGYWEKREGAKRILRVDPFTPTRDLAIDRLVVNVRLPEGAKYVLLTLSRFKR